MLGIIKTANITIISNGSQNGNQNSPLPSTPSVRWQCRRGMLELDMLLLPFFDTEYEKLDILLAYPDQELYGYLIGRELPDSPDLQSIVKRTGANI